MENIKLYENAVIESTKLEIKYSENNLFSVSKNKNYIVLSASAMCPCGTVELISIACVKQDYDYRMGLALHHGWHSACFNSGIDIETKCDDAILYKKGLEYKAVTNYVF